MHQLFNNNHSTTTKTTAMDVTCRIVNQQRPSYLISAINDLLQKPKAYNN